ncbi:MAG: acyl carrier protein [Candidatus Omnitrophota bacterium]
MSTKEQVRDTIIKLLKIKPEELKDAQPLEDCLGVDSTEMVEINIALTKVFGIQFEEKEVGKNFSVEQIAGIIDSKKS